jgi:hypothetical protein
MALSTQMPEIESKLGKVRWEVPILEITTNKAIFHLRHPINVTISRETDAWSYELEELSILSFGETSDAALRSFSEDFHAMWDIIGKSPDERLTPDALRVKQRLLDLVESAVQ